ncbi:hypothetical protein DFH07DRAFT_776052 [Mycena maculata]|uniref:Uncharacterized protein n=1 Tax=Mycena maculata TaxID=230809 RepID=A0AAD7N5K1_9AGAR|nr:hypothetical protein DFH07DRAFT_776052 [Mycena maculata]
MSRRASAGVILLPSLAAQVTREDARRAAALTRARAPRRESGRRRETRAPARALGPVRRRGGGRAHGGGRAAEPDATHPRGRTARDGMGWRGSCPGYCGRVSSRRWETRSGGVGCGMAGLGADVRVGAVDVRVDVEVEVAVEYQLDEADVDENEEGEEDEDVICRDKRGRGVEQWAPGRTSLREERRWIFFLLYLPHSLRFAWMLTPPAARADLRQRKGIGRGRRAPPLSAARGHPPAGRKQDNPTWRTAGCNSGGTRAQIEYAGGRSPTRRSCLARVRAHSPAPISRLSFAAQYVLPSDLAPLISSGADLAMCAERAGWMCIGSALTTVDRVSRCYLRPKETRDQRGDERGAVWMEGRERGLRRNGARDRHANSAGKAARRCGCARSAKSRSMGAQVHAFRARAIATAGEDVTLEKVTMRIRRCLSGGELDISLAPARMIVNAGFGGILDGTRSLYAQIA